MINEAPTAFAITNAVETHEGDAVIVRRLFPVVGLHHQDPFVLWDHFTVAPGSGFPPHPHRGFEAITYLFSGAMAHEDNLGNRSTIGPGGAQRFTAGRGIVHSEMPASEEAACGIQVWINLAQAQKQIAPDYQGLQAELLPVEKWPGGQRRIIVGEGSPLVLQTAVTYFELMLEPKGSFHWQVPEDFKGLLYVAEGTVRVNDNSLSEGQALQVFQPAPLALSSESGGRIMVCFGRAHNEPIRQHGTFVD
jgi:redox-sensitive bicupin YhaK (pirin superfamily)